MPTVPNPSWKHGELGPGTWYTADGHTLDELPWAAAKNKFRDPILWPVLTTGLYAQLVSDYPDPQFDKSGPYWAPWTSYGNQRTRLRLPRNLAAQMLLESFRDGQRHGLAYEDADSAIRVFLPQVIAPAQDDREWLWLDVERPDDPAVSLLEVYTVGVVHMPEEAEA